MDSRRAGGGNRMMTSTTLSTNDMWSKTIGYDPHAAAAPEEAPEDAEDRERRAERDKGVMELARLATINQGGGNRGAPRRPPARHLRSRVAKPGKKKRPPRAGDKFARDLFWGLKRKAPPKGYEMVALESSSSSDDSSDDDEAAAKRRRVGADDERKRRKRERKDAKREKKRAKKEAKRAKKASKKEKKKRSRDD